MIQYKNAINAIRQAAAIAPAIVGWMEGGWVVYNPGSPPDGVEPEMFIAAQGCIPVALSEVGAAVLFSALSLQ